MKRNKHNIFVNKNNDLNTFIETYFVYKLNWLDLRIYLHVMIFCTQILVANIAVSDGSNLKITTIKLF